jgi:hypothetical protein
VSDLILPYANPDLHCEDDDEGDFPLLPAWQGTYGGYPQTVIFCKYCLIYHRHGAGMYGHRLSHCALPLRWYYRHEDQRTPYDDTGYILVEGGMAPPEVQADLDWQSKLRYRFTKRTAAAEYYRVDEQRRVVKAAPEPRPVRIKKPIKWVRR